MFYFDQLEYVKVRNADSKFYRNKRMGKNDIDIQVESRNLYVIHRRHKHHSDFVFLEKSLQLPLKSLEKPGILSKILSGHPG